MQGEDEFCEPVELKIVILVDGEEACRENRIAGCNRSSSGSRPTTPTSAAPLKPTVSTTVANANCPIQSSAQTDTQGGGYGPGRIVVTPQSCCPCAAFRNAPCGGGGGIPPGRNQTAASCQTVSNGQVQTDPCQQQQRMQYQAPQTQCQQSMQMYTAAGCQTGQQQQAQPMRRNCVPKKSAICQTQGNPQPRKPGARVQGPAVQKRQQQQEVQTNMPQQQQDPCGQPPPQEPCGPPPSQDPCVPPPPQDPCGPSPSQGPCGPPLQQGPCGPPLQQGPCGPSLQPEPCGPPPPEPCGPPPPEPCGPPPPEPSCQRQPMSATPTYQPCQPCQAPAPVPSYQVCPPQSSNVQQICPPQAICPQVQSPVCPQAPCQQAQQPVRPPPQLICAIGGTQQVYIPATGPTRAAPDEEPPATTAAKPKVKRIKEQKEQPNMKDPPEVRRAKRSSVPPEELNFSQFPAVQLTFVDYFLKAEGGVASVVVLSECKLEFEKKCKDLLANMPSHKRKEAEAFFNRIIEIIQIKTPQANNTELKHFRPLKYLKPILDSMNVEAEQELAAVGKYHQYMLSVLNFMEERLRERQVINPDAMIDVETHLLAGIMSRFYPLFIKVKDTIKKMGRTGSQEVVPSEILLKSIRKLILACYVEIVTLSHSFDNTLTSLSYLPSVEVQETYRHQMGIRLKHARHSVTWAARCITTPFLWYHVKTVVAPMP